jgi:MFS family permease
MTTQDGTSRRATVALTLLVLINLFNYVDRQVLAAVEPEIRKYLFTDASGAESEDAKYWTGWLATAFLLSYMLIAPLFGLIADRVSRWGLVGFGVVLWSLASGASGIDWGVSLAMAFWILLATRCFVGVGEAAYGPVAPAMIADLFPIEKRGKIMAWFYLAIPVGGALGYALGEVVKNWIDWRWAFYCVVPPGLALGAWCFFMRDPPRGQSDSPAAEPAPGQSENGAGEPARKPGLRDYVFLLTIPSYTLNTLGMAMMTFSIGGLAYWMPEFLEWRKAPDLGPIGPRTVFGGITALAGLVSTLAGGMAGDWLRTRFSGSYFLVSGAALIAGFPMVLLVVWTSDPWSNWTWAFVFLAVFFLFFNTGPTNTILANVTHSSMRASAFALNILIIHTLGDAISPPLLGWVSGTEHMDRGFVVVSAAMLVGGVFWLVGAPYLKRDTEAAARSLPS